MDHRTSGFEVMENFVLDTQFDCFFSRLIMAVARKVKIENVRTLSISTRTFNAVDYTNVRITTTLTYSDYVT